MADVFLRVTSHVLESKIGMSLYASRVKESGNVSLYGIGLFLVNQLHVVLCVP